MSIESKKAADDAAQYLSEPDEVEARDALWNGEVLQIVLMIALAILQFVAIFWFLARSRMYTIYPGSEGVTFDDYRGQPELVEQARQIVTLLKGVRRFEEMGGLFGGMGSMGLLSTMLVEMSGFSLDYGLRAKLARLRPIRVRTRSGRPGGQGG